MTKLSSVAALILAMAAAPALAQEAGLSLGEAGTEDSPPAQQADGVGSNYVDATFTDWERICVRTEDGNDPCQIYQLLTDQGNNSVAEISIFPLPPGQEAAAGATFLAPLETLLPAQLTMQVDDGQAKRYPFTFCNAMGCVARVGFTAEEIELFKRGSVARWFLVPAAAPDQQVVAEMSLMGFTAAFDSFSQ